MQNIDNQQINKKSIKIAISGGCGFIGSELINYFNQQGYTNIDIFEKLDSLHNKWQNIAGLQFNAIYDYLDLQKDDVYPQYQWVILMGGNSSTSTKKEEFQQTLFDNFTYPTELMGKIARCYNPEFDSSRRQKVIFASSAATYGLSNNFKERITDIKPSNFYGLTKLMVDRFMTNELFGKWIYNNRQFYSFRFFNVFGKNETHKAEANMTSPVSRFLAQKPPFILYNSANPEILTDQMARDFIAVQDVCQVILWTLENNVQESIYNLGSGKATTWKELLQIVCELKGYKFDEVVQYQDMPDSIRSHYQYITKADISKLRAAGYLTEMTDIKNAIKELIKE